MHRVARTAVLFALVWPAASAAGQYTVALPDGRTMDLERSDVLEMHERSERLRENLEQDPRVLYFLTFGPVAEEAPGDAWPWNAIEVVTDSIAGVVTPGNLREADRAYANYAVLRMRAVRADPDVACEELVDREVQALDGFIDGWVVARTLFGGPAYEPFDRLIFARRDGVVSGLLVAQEDPQVGGCLAVWAAEHPEAAESYRAWLETPH